MRGTILFSDIGIFLFGKFSRETFDRDVVGVGGFANKILSCHAIRSRPGQFDITLGEDPSFELTGFCRITHGFLGEAFSRDLSIDMFPRLFVVETMIDSNVSCLKKCALEFLAINQVIE